MKDIMKLKPKANQQNWLDAYLPGAGFNGYLFFIYIETVILNYNFGELKISWNDLVKFSNLSLKSRK